MELNLKDMARITGGDMNALRMRVQTNDQDSSVNNDPGNLIISRGIHHGSTVTPNIGRMFFGLTDANNEFVSSDSSRFMSLFCSNPKFDVGSVLDGSVSFVFGSKGTGKTMFLRYAELMAQQGGSPTRFVRYGRSVTDADKKRLRQIGNASEEQVYDESARANAVTNDYVIGWQLYLIKVIAFMLMSSESDIFSRDSEEWGKLTAILSDVYGMPKTSGMKRLIPKLNKGQITLKSKYAELALDFVPGGPEGKRKVSFIDLAQRVVDLYSELHGNCDAVPAYVFIDEIELSLGQKKEYERNILLVRDLVFAVAQLNDIAREHAFPVRIVVALRSEVVHSVKSRGYEINKPIEDYGVEIDWRSSTDDIDNNPLIRIVEKRVLYNMPTAGDNPDIVWREFFPQSVNNTPVKHYILRQTWNKPRDIVRLLNTLKRECPNKVRVGVDDFRLIRLPYAKSAWDEIAEELRTNYSIEFVSGIERMLLGINCPFSMHELGDRLDIVEESYPSVRVIKEKMSLPEIIETLYKFGIVGNVESGCGRTDIWRFAAFGDDEPDIQGRFNIHYPLRYKFK